MHETGTASELKNRATLGVTNVFCMHVPCAYHRVKNAVAPPYSPVCIFFSVSSRDSSVGRASDRRSEGPRFDPGSRHFLIFLHAVHGHVLIMHPKLQVDTYQGSGLYTAMFSLE